MVRQDDAPAARAARPTAEAKQLEEEMIQSFRVFDLNGTGYVSPPQLKHAMANMLISKGKTLTDEEEEELVRVADVDHDGIIDYKNFARMICN